MTDGENVQYLSAVEENRKEIPSNTRTDWYVASGNQTLSCGNAIYIRRR